MVGRAQHRARFIHRHHCAGTNCRRAASHVYSVFFHHRLSINGHAVLFLQFHTCSFEVGKARSTVRRSMREYVRSRTNQTPQTLYPVNRVR